MPDVRRPDAAHHHSQQECRPRASAIPEPIPQALATTLPKPFSAPTTSLATSTLPKPFSAPASSLATSSLSQPFTPQALPTSQAELQGQERQVCQRDHTSGASA